MGTKTISLDKDAEQILNKIKEQNPTFNFSAFIQEALQKQGGHKLDESTILKHISDAELMEKSGKDAILFWRKKQEEFAVAKAMEDKNLQEKEKERLAELEQKEERARINEYLTDFNRENPKWAEYQDGLKEGRWKGITEFARGKMREEQK